MADVDVDEVDVVDAPERSRYEARIDGRVAGFVQYEIEDGVRALVHTEVDEEFEGQGVGSRLATGVFDDVRRRGTQVVNRCEFLARWLEDHPEQQELVTAGSL